MNERRRAAAVEVDRILATEGDHEPRELSEVEAGVHPGPAAVAGDRKELRAGQPEGTARMALGGDIRVELRRARREALAVLAINERTAARDQHRARCDEIAGRLIRELAAGGQTNIAIDVDRRATRAPRLLDRLVSRVLTADSNVSERAVRVPEEEAGDDRLRLVVLGAPDVEPACVGKRISRGSVLAR
jgi:hypothetical protein